MKRKIRSLYDSYRSGDTDRREFIKKLAVYAGSVSAAVALLPLLDENFAHAALIHQDDPDLVTEFINYPVEKGQMRAFMARPKEKKKYPAVIVIHENRGLVPHILDVNRRMAKEGFLCIAPDALSPLGGTPEDQQKGMSMFRELDSNETVRNFVAAVKYLETHPLSNGKVGCTGFCWGGAMTNQVAVNAPSLGAAVPYYGRQPQTEDVAKIKAPIMAHYGENDEGINKGIPAFEEALKKNNKKYQIFIYEGAAHAFNNDSNPERYNEKAAKLAWKRTVDFFKENLKNN